MKYVIHIFLFLLSWGACVFGALNGATWISFCVSATCLSLAILLVSPKRRVDVLKVALIVPLGVAFEFINESLPLYNFIPESKYPPVWMLCFWPAFTILFVETLEFLYDRNILVKLFFGFLGGASYWAGHYFDLIHFRGETPYIAMAAFATLWAIEFLLLLRISQLVDRKAFKK